LETATGKEKSEGHGCCASISRVEYRNLMSLAFEYIRAKPRKSRGCALAFVFLYLVLSLFVLLSGAGRRCFIPGVGGYGLMILCIMIEVAMKHMGYEQQLYKAEKNIT
jgi:hypothetical protein